MNIVAHKPANFLSSNQTDRLGAQAKGIQLNDLAQLPHGCVIFGLADDTGIANVGGRIGAKLGPIAIREKLYRFATSTLRFPLYDLGDLQPEKDIESTHHNAHQIIQAIHTSGHIPIVIGGGHDLGYPQAKALASFTQKKIHVVNIDAHLDLRDVDSGITSGSPWYLLLEDTSLPEKPLLTEFGIQAH